MLFNFLMLFEKLLYKLILKMNRWIIFFSIFSYSVMCIPVQAEFDPMTNTLTYKGETFGISEENGSLGGGKITMNIIIIAFLTIFAGIMSGLTVGYLSIDDLVLELKSNTGTETEKYYAKRVLPIISKRHWLLVTLLLCNAAAMEALPIFLNRLVPEALAIIISVTLVLFFGEIIPQALCTGPGQLKIASFLSTLTSFLMKITYPLSYPISLLLDKLVGKHSKSRFVNTDLKGLIELHTLEALEKLNQEEEDYYGHSPRRDVNDEMKKEMGLHSEQANLMISALEIKDKKTVEMMIPIKNVYMLEYNTRMDKSTVQHILDKGFSRIPVYERTRDNVVGILRIKQLIGIDIESNTGKTLKQFGLKLSVPLIVSPRTLAIDLLREFKKGKSHMALVAENLNHYPVKGQFGVSNVGSYIVKPSSMMLNEEDELSQLTSEPETSKSASGNDLLGIITLEDVLEKMINIEILDEDDFRIKNIKMHPPRKSKFYSTNMTDLVSKSLIKNKADDLNLIIEGSYRKSFFDNLNEKNYSYVQDNNPYRHESHKDNPLKEPLL
jgi:metal transporter CNNM